jgi:zinc transport system ATP-binding protein
MASLPVLDLRGVSVSFRDVPVLEDVNLSLDAGEYLAVLGPNGGGKTTLLKVILGLIRPDRGEVRVFGVPPERARGRIGYAPQFFRFDLDFPIRVIDVVLMGRLAKSRLLRPTTRRDRAVAEAMLAKVEMDELADRQIGKLSGGQLQRVLIARALAVEPQLLLLDEPTASLDERIGHSIWELIEKLSHELTVVLVSHDIGAISRYVRSVACLNRRLFFHPSKALTPEILEATYGCPIELVAHGQPHRVLPKHSSGEKR